jgi:hypothetical protein
MGCASQCCLLIRPYEGSTPFGLSQSKPLDELAIRQAQGERLQTFKGRINKTATRASERPSLNHPSLWKGLEQHS